MDKREQLHGLLEIDRHVTTRVLVRRWRHQSAVPLPRWPACAHETVELAWAECGSARYVVGGRELELEIGTLVIVPAETDHRTVIAPGTVATSIQLSRALVDEVQDLVGGASLSFCLREGEAVRTIAGLMLEEARREDPSFVSTDALAEALVAKLFEENRQQTRADPRIGRAIAAVQERFSEPLTVDDLARAAGMSRYHFTRTFRAEVGQTPYQYLVRTRVRRAADLLRKRRTVTEAAFGVGFNDLGRFARAFRRELGCPPSAYR